MIKCKTFGIEEELTNAYLVPVRYRQENVRTHNSLGNSFGMHAAGENVIWRHAFVLA